VLTHGLFLLVGLGLGAGLVWVIAQQDRLRLQAVAVRLETERDAAIRDAATERERAADSQQQTRDVFASLSRTALKENRDDFLHDATGILAPLRETLGRVQVHLADVDKLREGSFQAVSTELQALRHQQEHLRSATEGLSRSLGSPNVRGAWGEFQLRRIVELAGMIEHCDFDEKVTATSEDDSRQTPDLIVRLPGHATIAIDSKVPISAYQSAMAADTASVRDQFLGAHARQVRDHMRALGDKEYWKLFHPSPDFVVMFLPLESLLPAAFERDASLFDLAATSRVIPATPLTLLALLKAIASGWRHQQLADNAEDIQRIGRELYERLATMVGHLEGVGEHLTRAAGRYNDLVGSLEQNVLPGARRFKQLGVTSTKDLAELDRLHLEIRAVVKPELTGRTAADLIDAALSKTEH
jgi:DNA recombination protein RmuC